MLNTFKRISGREMVLVEGGTFEMGGETDNPRGWALPIHTVRVESFYIGKYLITQKDWLEVMGFSDNTYIGDNVPEFFINWYKAIEFCNALSRKEGLECVYDIRVCKHFSAANEGSDETKTYIDVNQKANGYRLPTEAEWEFAARGGNKSEGFLYSGSNDLDEVGYYSDNKEDTDKFPEVGEKKPNELGIYDMSGHLWEWCWDRFGRYPAGSSKDPDGLITGSHRVLRGGTRMHKDSWCTVFFRWRGYPDGFFPAGVRLCRNIL